MSVTTGNAWRRGLLAGVALALAAVLSQASASAETDEERSGARAAAQEGASAFKEHRWADAVDMFTRAESLVHSPVHLLFIARSRDKLGQLVEAREYYLKITREGISDSAPAAFLKAQQDAQKELATLEPRLAYITVSVQGRNPNEVTVKMDGRVVPPALVGVPRPVNPGEHSFQASANGEESSLSKVTVKEGGRETVVLTLEAAQAAAAATTPAGAQPQATPAAGPNAEPGAGTGTTSDDKGPNMMRIGSYIGFGVGAVGLGLGTVFLIQRGSKQSDSDDAYDELVANCSPGATAPSGYDCRSGQDEVQSLDDDAASAGTLATVGFVTGILGVGAGITLFILSSQDESAAAASTSATVHPYVGPGSVGVFGTF